MKKIFIECKYNIEPKLLDSEIKKIPKTIKTLALVSTVQYVHMLKEIKEILHNHNFQVIIPKGYQKYPGQILGCDVDFKLKNTEIKNIDAFLFLGDGFFHPTKLMFKYNKPVYTLSINGKISEIKKEIVSKYKKKKKGAMLKFLTNSEIGVLFTQKPGQKRDFKLIKSLEKLYPKKNFYTFYANEINLNSLENFPFIKAWINTACPRIEEDFTCVNIDDLKI